MLQDFTLFAVCLLPGISLHSAHICSQIAPSTAQCLIWDGMPAMSRPQLRRPPRAGVVHVPHPDAGLHLRRAVPGGPGRAVHRAQPAPRLAALRLRLLHLPPGPARARARAGRRARPGPPRLRRALTAPSDGARGSRHRGSGICQCLCTTSLPTRLTLF